jgi:hypothetical protein
LTAARPDPIADAIEAALADQEPLALDRHEYPVAVRKLIRICEPKIPNSVIPLIIDRHSHLVAPKRAATIFGFCTEHGFRKVPPFTLQMLRKLARKSADGRVALALIGHPYSKRLRRRERAALLLRQLVRR